MFIALVLILFVGVVCDANPAATCAGDKFPCTDGSCIDKSKWCDAEVDCEDGSDENYCYTSSNLRPIPNKCGETFFVCKDGPCIPLVGRCDGYRSCYDNSDEDGCPTTVAAPEPQVTHIALNVSLMDLENNTTELPMTVRYFTPTTEGFLEEIYENTTHDDVLHDDSKLPKLSATKAEDLEKGFVALDTRQFKRYRALAKKWLLNVRDEDYGWGDETHRALIALHMSGEYLIQGQDDGDMLMSKQLHLKLFTALIRNRTMPLPVGELSLFINALSASCDNPKDFYGQDLVSILRHRTDKTQESPTFITPLVYLTLCLNDATTYGDVKKIQEYLNDFKKIDKIDIEALVSLAATCISRTPKFADSIGKQVARKVALKVAQEGLPENIYQLSLVTQALNEARINQAKWNRSEALRLVTSHQDVNGSFGDILSTYYAMPVLSGTSLLSLGQHCDAKDNGLTPLGVLKNGGEEEIYIRYTLQFGSPLEVSQTLIIKVKKLTNLLDVMRIAETISPVYKFRYDMSVGKPTVYSIGGVVNDPECGLYWRLYVSANSTAASNLSPYEGDIRSFTPGAENNIVFWRKSLY